ncbi:MULTISPECIES: C-GCAxxG-C-C family (seleno)protein [Clostridium]|uniref:C-GCAxxG-C-C family (seleno)protein n=1 Tax=Clostridium TaxID=1485 RepID=UPI0008267764|nr:MULTISPECIES: C-GCAxxG-C-C family (seleno)protein [Clostridium]PJI07967.1 oxidoreductase [Clostridium sp. CT7]
MKASEYLKEGFNCAESIIKAFNEEHNTDIPVKIGSGMGGGFSSGSLCGAVGASAMIIGYLKGRENNDEENNARKYVKEFMDEVKEDYGTEICRELKRDKVSCGDIVDYSYMKLNEKVK